MAKIPEWLRGADLPTHPGMTATGLSTEDRESDAALKEQYERRQQRIKQQLAALAAPYNVFTGRPHNS